MDIHIRLPEYLAQHRVKPIALVRAADGKASQGAIYALAKGKTKRIDLNTLAVVMGAIKRVTGNAPTFDDLLEFVPSPEPKEPPQDEDTALLEADLGGLGRYEPYDWGADGEPEGQPVQYVEGEGLYVGTDTPGA